MNKRTRDRILNKAINGPKKPIHLAPLRRVISQPYRYSNHLPYLAVKLACGHRADWYGEERIRRRCLECYYDPNQLRLF